MACFYQYKYVTTLHSGKPFPIILIDDDTDDLQFMEDGLMKLMCEHTVLCFHDPFEALYHLQHKDSIAYSIVCDVHMPKLDGYAIRKKMLEGKSIINNSPFFLMSAGITERETNQMRLLQIRHCYTKAFTDEQSLTNLRHMLCLTADFYS